MDLELKNRQIDYLQITDNAVLAIKQKLLGKEEVFGLRLAIKTKGCSGLSYDISLARKENISSYDEVAVKEGIKIFIDPKASLFLFNSVMDFVEKKTASGFVIESGFVFNNPNETGRCGCGESFYV